jgi:hypothetical protein
MLRLSSYIIKVVPWMMLLLIIIISIIIIIIISCQKHARTERKREGGRERERASERENSSRLYVGQDARAALLTHAHKIGAQNGEAIPSSCASSHGVA